MTAERAYEDTDPDRVIEGPEPVRPLVYLVVGLGAAMSAISVLIASDGFGFATMLTLLVAMVPYLVFARLALVQPGADAVIAGIMLLAIGMWGSFSYFRSDLVSFVQLSAYLLAIVVVVFGLGVLLRHTGGAQETVEPSPPFERRRDRRARSRQ